MAQINLLKQKSRTQVFLQHLPVIAVRLLIAVGLLVVAYYVFLFVQLNSINKGIASLSDKIEQQKSAAVNSGDRQELLIRQGQLKELNGLIDKHVYWSLLLPQLAKATLNTATYSDLKALNDGTIVLSVEVPNLEELDKFLQVFDLSDFNKNFSDVKIGSFHKTESENSTSIQFDVNFRYNPELIKYQPIATGF